MTAPLRGRVALVAGATRGAGRGIAVGLGEAGATVYCSGRSTRGRRLEYDRPETIEETAELVTEAGGTGSWSRPTTSEPAQVRDLVQRIDAEQGRPGRAGQRHLGRGEALRVERPGLGARPRARPAQPLRLAIDTHLITSHYALPLLLRNPAGCSSR